MLQCSYGEGGEGELAVFLPREGKGKTEVDAFIFLCLKENNNAIDLLSIVGKLVFCF